MLGGSDVVNSSRCHIRNLDVRDRLRKLLSAINSRVTVTVTDATSHGAPGRAVVRYDSCWRPIAGE
jgi:hypothetical protein